MCKAIKKCQAEADRKANYLAQQKYEALRGCGAEAKRLRHTIAHNAFAFRTIENCLGVLRLLAQWAI